MVYKTPDILMPDNRPDFSEEFQKIFDAITKDGGDPETDYPEVYAVIQNASKEIGAIWDGLDVVLDEVDKSHKLNGRYLETLRKQNDDIYKFNHIDHKNPAGEVEKPKWDADQIAAQLRGM